MNLIERLKKIEAKLFTKKNDCEVIFYESDEDLKNKIKQGEIDVPINLTDREDLKKLIHKC